MRGRPPKRKEDRKTEKVQIPFTPADKRIVAQAARNSDMDLAAWLRRVALEAARKEQTDSARQ